MYISIDLETTGISFDCAILEIALVDQNGRSFHRVIRHDRFEAEPAAMIMNHELLKRCVGCGEKWCDVLKDLYSWLYHYSGKPFALGKNVAGFDAPFLIKKGFPFYNYFSHRVLDVGSLYADLEGIPSLSVIAAKVLPQGEHKEHNALSDAKVCMQLALRRLGPDPTMVKLAREAHERGDSQTTKELLQ